MPGLGEGAAKGWAPKCSGLWSMFLMYTPPGLRSWDDFKIDACPDSASNSGVISDIGALNFRRGPYLGPCRFWGGTMELPC